MPGKLFDKSGHGSSSFFCLKTHPDSYESNNTERESENCNESQDTYEPNRIPIEFEADWFWEQHRPNEGSFRRVEA